MIINILVRITYALIFGGMVAYVAQGLFHDGWVSAAFGAVTVAAFGVWNLRRATVPRDRQLGSSGRRISRFMATRTGLAVMAVALVLALGLVWLGGGDCPSTDAAGKCRMPSHMNW
ncbi:hypothetical protein [Streptomyces sp. NPDC051684]|uniref:hypothetical protein n=1 Tax=Streptomyces sp. NPDC051684 TaxID=3365670 RepID=UPI0037A03FB0